MKFLNAVIGAVLALAPATGLALDYPWLTFKLTDATEIAVAAENLEMNYSDGMLYLTSSVVNQTLNVAELRSMQFSADSSGLEAVGLAVDESAEYFSVGGQAVGRYESPAMAREALPSGVYIGKSESKTFKVIF